MKVWWGSGAGAAQAAPLAASVLRRASNSAPSATTRASAAAARPSAASARRVASAARSSASSTLSSALRTEAAASARAGAAARATTTLTASSAAASASTLSITPVGEVRAWARAASERAASNEAEAAASLTTAACATAASATTAVSCAAWVLGLALASAGRTCAARLSHCGVVDRSSSSTGLAAPEQLGSSSAGDQTVVATPCTCRGADASALSVATAGLSESACAACGSLSQWSLASSLPAAGLGNKRRLQRSSKLTRNSSVAVDKDAARTRRSGGARLRPTRMMRAAAGRDAERDGGATTDLFVGAGG